MLKLRLDHVKIVFCLFVDSLEDLLFFFRFIVEHAKASIFTADENILFVGRFHVGCFHHTDGALKAPLCYKLLQPGPEKGTLVRFFLRGA